VLLGRCRGMASLPSRQTASLSSATPDAPRPADRLQGHARSKGRTMRHRQPGPQRRRAPRGEKPPMFVGWDWASRPPSRWRPPPAGGRRRGAGARRLYGAPGRAGRHPGATRPQAAGQDRPDRRPPPAGAAARWHAAGVVDAACPYRRRAHPGPAALRASRGHTGWYQRIHAILFHHGLPDRSWLLTADGRAWPGWSSLRWPARQSTWPSG
jgi:hypothetical protein